MNPNHHMLCVFQPYDREFWDGRRRFFVKAKKLWYFIGKKNAERLTEQFYRSGKDKDRRKVKGFGILDFYSK